MGKQLSEGRAQASKPCARWSAFNTAVLTSTLLQECVEHASSVRADSAEYEAVLHSDEVLGAIMAVCSTLRTAGALTERGSAERRDNRAPALCGASTALP